MATHRPFDSEMAVKISARVTRQNQLTLPAPIRRRLGVEGGGTIVFDLSDDDIRIEGRDLTLEEIFGSIKLPERASDDFDEEIEQALDREVERFFDPSRIRRP